MIKNKGIITFEIEMSNVEYVSYYFTIEEADNKIDR